MGGNDGFYAVLEHIRDLLQRRGRVTYRALKVQFQLDDEPLEVLKEELIEAERLAEQVDHLAHHAVRGAVWDKALTYCRQAGVRATARSAYREAVAYFEQALAALAQLPERRDTAVTKVIGAALTVSADW
jgi:predicted ATPase